MRKIGSFVYWLGLGIAMFMFLTAADIVHRGIAGLLLFCLGVGLALYLAGSWVRRMDQRSAPDA